MIFYECGGGAEEKILSFKLSAANGTQGNFYGGRYWKMNSKDQAYVPVQKNGNDIVYTNGATRVIHIRFRIDSAVDVRKDLGGVRYGSTYYNAIPRAGLSAQSSTAFVYVVFSSDGKNNGPELIVYKSDVPYATGVWYDLEYGWDKDTKEIYLEVSDELGNYKKVTGTLNTLYQYSTDYEYSVGLMNRDDSYAGNVTFDLWNTWYEENHSRLVWGIKGG